jgi:hypothetical protein
VGAVNQALTFGGLLAAFLLRGRRKRTQEVVAYDDPQRDPNWCWTHNMLWPACAGMH